MGRYPRTVDEFAHNDRHVLVQCGLCRTKREVAAETLAARFGAAFDLYDGYARLVAELGCPGCGRTHRTIVFRDATEYAQFGEVGFEEALNRELERRAYIRARGEESQAVRGPRRRRG